eukprot:scaffold32211_cov76-Cyclotella_meneghiniana.AAC.4
MKFCRNLQRVIGITDPEWAPYWTNYKMLKKLLKTLPTAVPSDAGSSSADEGTAASTEDANEGGDDVISMAGGRDEPEQSKTTTSIEFAASNTSESIATKMARRPGEVAFFRLLNSELRKAVHFFDKAQLEYEVREARVRDGIDIMRKANSLMVTEKWSLMAKSLYRLYKDLLLLETYAIMTYCSFSKILKKHDKVTSLNTRIAFMKNVVNKANFTHYPKLLAMISRCENLYEEVSQSLIQEGKLGLYEDERLFINMIHRLNEQVLDTAEEEGADLDVRKERRGTASIQGGGPTSPHIAAQSSPSFSSSSSSTAAQVNTLRSLVEENSINKSSKEGLARVQEHDNLAENTAIAAEALAGMTSSLDNKKRSLSPKSPNGATKKARAE